MNTLQTDSITIIIPMEHLLILERILNRILWIILLIALITQGPSVLQLLQPLLPSLALP